jgi:hypothetical protein
MSFYLDTNAIRKIGRNLSDVSKKVPVKVSVLGQIEILSRASADFQRCQSQLSIIEKSGIQIDKDMPDKLLLNGFDYVDNLCSFVEDRVPCLDKVIATLINSQNWPEFSDAESKLQLSHPFEYFYEYDKDFGVEFNKGFIEETKIIRRAFELAKSGQAATLMPPEVLSGNFQNFCKWFLDKQELINESVTVNGLAQRAVSELQNFGIKGNHSVGEIHDSYNGKNSAFVGAISRLTMFTHANGGQPGRNDALDLAHLLYIREGDLLVTSDAKMIGLANEIGLPVKSPEEVLSYLVPTTP